jgi:ligand-binding sensor domain-containing protein
MRNISYEILILLLFFITKPSYSQDFWELVNSPPNANPAHITISNTNIFYLGTDNGVYISYDNGNSWDNIGLNDTIVISLLLFQEKIYAGTMSIGSGLYRYIDNGIWENLIVTDNVLDLFSNNNNDLFAGTWGGVYKSNNNGDIWIQTLTITTTAAVFSIREDMDGILYAGTTNFTGGEGVFRSLDHGDTWEYFGLHDVYVSSLAVNSNNELFAGAQGHQYLFEDGAGVYKYDKSLQQWIQQKDHLIVTTMVINSEDEIYIGLSNDMGNYGGVYVSYDDGLTWELLESGLGKDHMKQIILSPDEYLYTISGLTTSTIHKSVNPTVGTGEVMKAIKPVVYNYPNPFNGETCIYFSLPGDANEDFSLSVFDLAGNIVVNDNLKSSPQTFL